MNKAMIRGLYHELPELVAKGVLNQETADKLQQYYGEVKDTSKTAVSVIILGTIGAFLTGLGIILLFAHNWEHLSRFTRAVLSLAPLLMGQGLALWVIWKRPQSAALKEGVATFLTLMVGASIGLIGQTYNIPGDARTFILTWMLLIIPITYLMQASLPAAVFLIGITAWSGFYWNDPVRAVLFWPLAAMTIPHFIWALRRQTYSLRATILSLIMGVCASFAAVYSLGTWWVGSWVIIFPSLYSIFYSLGCIKTETATSNWQRPLRLIGGLGLFILAFQFTYRGIWQYLAEYSGRINRNISVISVIPDYIITLALVTAAILLFYHNLRRRNWTVSLFGAVPVLAIAAYLGRGVAIVPLLIFNSYLFVLSISRIVAGVRGRKIGEINTGMLMLAILIAARFYDSGISFIIKGVVFIIIGLGFLAANLFILRRKGGAK